jgi:hypothetical protein
MPLHCAMPTTAASRPLENELHSTKSEAGQRQCTRFMRRCVYAESNRLVPQLRQLQSFTPDFVAPV